MNSPHTSAQHYCYLCQHALPGPEPEEAGPEADVPAPLLHPVGPRQPHRTLFQAAENPKSGAKI